MERHLLECVACAKLDSEVRRGLLLFRNNLPSIEPSADFASRLDARLDQERRRAIAPPLLFRGPGMGGFLAMSVGMVTVGLLALAVGELPPSENVVRLPAVVLMPDREGPAPVLSGNAALPVAPSALVASVSTGMAVWPALLLLEEAPSRYVGAGSSARTPAVRAVNYTGRREAR